MSFLSFPREFLWGTSTAAHQVEGQNFNNDWWDWEQTPGHIRNGDTSRVACDWWGGRYKEDFDRAKLLGTKAHRLSVEWSRIEPRQGEYDPEAILYYRRMLEALRDRGMTPFVTLFHFTLPRWLAAQGGWENPTTIQKFARFARHAVRELADLCTFWNTVNEPNVYAYSAYASGQFPPGVKDIRRALSVLANELRAHAGAYHVIKDVQPEAQVGVAFHYRYFYPYRKGAKTDLFTVLMRDRVFHRTPLMALEDGHFRFPLGSGNYAPEVRGALDFHGLNYYYADPVMFDPTNPGEFFGRTILNMRALALREIFSSVGNLELCGLEATLTQLSQFHRPIYITENGIFDDGHDLQSEYLVSHLRAVQSAMQAGADVRGYFWWSLLDNFEWAEGYTPRFGLFQLDVETQNRTRRPVADTYAQIIRENGLADDLQEKYGRPDRIQSA